MTARATLLLCLLAVACGEKPRAARRPDAAAAERPAMPPGHGLEIERIAAVPPRTRVIGIVRRDVPSMLAHDAQRDAPRGGPIDTADTGLVLDVERAGRVTVAAHSRIEIGDLDGAEIILREGIVQASQAVEGNSDRPSLRIATPRGTVLLTSGGEVLVAVTKSGKVFVGGWSGAVELRDGATPEDGGVARPRILVGGGTMVLEAGKEPVVSTVEGSVGLEAQLRAEGVRFLGADRATARTCTVESEAAAARLTGLGARRTALEALRVQHADLVRARSSAVSEVSRHIIAETQGVLRDRDAVLVWLERAHACAESRETSPVTPLLETARTALAPSGRRP
jgi:hypothetical protein